MSVKQDLINGKGFISESKDYTAGGVCASIALSKAASERLGPSFFGVESSTPAKKALAKAMGIEKEFWEKGPKAIYDWNDNHSHAEVLAAFDKAIAEA